MSYLSIIVRQFLLWDGCPRSLVIRLCLIYLTLEEFYLDWYESMQEMSTWTISRQNRTVSMYGMYCWPLPG